MAIVKKISELTPKGSALSNTDLLIVGVDNGTDYDLKSVTGAQVLGNVVSQTITDGVTTKSPSENAVYDALALKVDKVAGSRLITSAESTLLGNTSGTNTGDETVTTIKTKLGITTLSGSNTGDQDLSGYVKTTTNQTIAGEKTFTSNTVHDLALKIKHGTSSSSIGYTGIGANVDQLIVGVTGATQTLTFPNIANYIYTFPSATGTLALTTDLTNKIDSNTAITGATKTKITYDSKGLVTSGADATTADIADSLNKRYVTDANLTTIGNTSGTNTGDQIISDATLTTTDITTNNVSITKHGFAPKAPNNTTQFLRGDGTWATPSAGGLTYFTEAQSTASPNATVNVDSLTAVASTTNADIVIRPKGTGAILGNIPDNTATGGNKRGANAVDLQTIRNAATDVANGDYSVISGGYRNKASGLYSAVVGGFISAATGESSTNLGGYASNATGYSALTFGYQCQSNGTASIALGATCVVAGNYSIAMGNSNNLSGRGSIALGESITMNELWNFASGYGHSVNGRHSNVTGVNGSDNGVWGRQVFSVNNTSIGDAQSSKLVLSKRTTDATSTVLTVQGGSVNSATQLTLTNANSIRFKGSIIGRQSGSTNTSAWDIDGIIQRGTSAGTTTLLISNVNVVQNTPSWGTPTLTANTTLGCLTVTVIGATSTNIQWTCVIDTTEVIYA